MENNTANNNPDEGIQIYHARHSRLYSNRISGGGNGILLEYAEAALLRWNLMTGNGIVMRGDNEKYWNTHTMDTSNTINGRPLHYMANATSGTAPAGAGEVILASSMNVVVDGQNCSGGSAGVILGYSSWNRISNSTFNRNSLAGAYLYHSENNQIENTTFAGNNDGVFLEYYSSYNTIFNCTFEQNRRNGVNESSIYYTKILNSDFEGNGYTGVFLYGAGYTDIKYNKISHNRIGILVSSTMNTNILNNTFTGNIDGIRLRYYSQSTGAHYNSIYANRDYGINASGNNGYTVDATDNWWGNSSGPYHPVSNPDGTGDNVTDYVSFNPWTEENVNQPPQAYIDSITPDPATTEETVTFSGHGTDDEGVVRYLWTSDIDGELYDGSASHFTITGLSAGTHTISLRVQDSDGLWSGEATATITVRLRPTAVIDSVIPNPAIQGKPISFDGHGTDDGNIVRYVWTSSIDGELYNGTDGHFKTTLPSTGEHTISLRVQDNDGLWSDVVNITLFVHVMPTAEILSITPETALVGEDIVFRGQGAADTPIQRYVWLSSIDGELYNGPDGNITFSGLSAGTHSITLKVQDSTGLWSDPTAPVSVIVHTKPTAQIVSIDPNPAHTNQSITFTGRGTDDGTVVRYVWTSSIDGEFYSGPNATVSYTGLSLGNHTISLKVQDNYGVWSEPVTASLIIKPIILVDSTPPTLSILYPRQHAAVNGTVTIRGIARDNVKVVSVEYRAAGTEEWYTAEGTTEWHVTLNTTQVDNGNYTLEFRAYDGRQYSEILTLTVTVQNEESNGGSNGFIPGFETVEMAFALIGAVFLFRWRRRGM